MNLNRRDFLALGAMTAAAAAIPLTALAPKLVSVQMPLEVRFIRMYDPIIAKIVTRFDVLYGSSDLNPDITLPMPQIAEGGELLTNRKDGLTDERISQFINRCSEKYLGSSQHKVTAWASCIGEDYVRQSWEIEGVEFVG